MLKGVIARGVTERTNNAPRGTSGRVATSRLAACLPAVARARLGRD